MSLLPLTIAFLIALVPHAGFAANISLSANPLEVGVGEMVLVDVLIDSAMRVNAYAGELKYTEEIFEPIAIRDANSVINAWIIRPATTSQIEFAGITPGGFSGDQGILFSILFRAKTEGVGHIFLTEVQVLRNGDGAEIEPTSVDPLYISVRRDGESYVENDDVVSPDPFVGYLGKDESLFHGRYYLVFNAIDKQSGIERYEIAETRLPALLSQLKWKLQSDGIYEIKDQHLTSTLYIKAVDRAGNERISVFPRTNLMTLYEKLLVVGILIICAVLWQFRSRRKNCVNE